MSACRSGLMSIKMFISERPPGQSTFQLTHHSGQVLLLKCLSTCVWLDRGNNCARIDLCRAARGTIVKLQTSELIIDSYLKHKILGWHNYNYTVGQYFSFVTHLFTFCLNKRHFVFSIPGFLLLRSYDVGN